MAENVRGALHAFGIGRGDRVAIVLPNRPEMPAAFVTFAQVAVTAPLNHAYREEQYAFYMEDLKTKALVVMEGNDGPAVAAATEAGMAIICVTVPDGAAAGAIQLSSEACGTTDTQAPGPDDVASILHISGTTLRLKIYPCCNLMSRRLPSIFARR